MLALEGMAWSVRSDEQLVHADPQVMHRLDGVDSEVKSYFSNVAKLILDSRNPQDAMEVGRRRSSWGCGWEAGE